LVSGAEHLGSVCELLWQAVLSLRLLAMAFFVSGQLVSSLVIDWLGLELVAG
jgi:hypothetical protein